MIVSITANFMESDPRRTKLVFFVGDTTTEPLKHAGYLSMSNADADAFLQRGLPVNLARAHGIGNGHDSTPVDGDVYILNDKRGRRHHV